MLKNLEFTPTRRREHVRPATADCVPMLLTRLLALATLLAGGYHFALHVAAIRLPEPMGPWETVYAGIARVWPGQYQWEHYVEGHDGYGPGYPALVRPLLATGMDVYLAHRLTGLATLLLTCGLLVRALRRQGCTWTVSAALVAIFYSVNAGSYSIQARPDFPVLLVITLLLLWGDAAAHGRVGTGMVAGVLVGLLALAGAFTKAYALFAWAAVIFVLTLLLGPRQTWRLGVVSAAIVAAGVAWFAATQPLYLMEVYQGQVAQRALRLSWLVEQTADFSLLAGGLLLVSLTAGLVALRRALHSRLGDRLSQPLRMWLNLPPMERARWYWPLQAALAAAALLLGPGWHTGAYLTYYFHLLLVPLVFTAGRALAAGAGPRTALMGPAALTANLAVLVATAPSVPAPDPTWAALRADILAQPGRVAVDYLMEPMARARPDVLVVCTGQSGYTLQEPFLIQSVTPTVARARSVAAAYQRAQADALFGPEPAAAIYLDCLVTRAPDGRFSVLPRNGLDAFLGPEMKAYEIAQTFEIRPFYFATNAPRQTAGQITTTIVKFVRKP